MLKDSVFSIDIPYSENPNWQHTTLASSVSQKSLHIVPHVPFMHTSTRPNVELADSVEVVRRMTPLSQRAINTEFDSAFIQWLYYNLRWHFRPTSLEWVQEVPTNTDLEHSKRFCSDPLQPTFVINTGPLAVPKVELAVRYTTRPAKQQECDSASIIGLVSSRSKVGIARLQPPITLPTNIIIMIRVYLLQHYSEQTHIH